jgi:beta-galactosidase
MRELAEKLESTRERIEVLMRPLLNRSFSFTAVNVQAPIPPDCRCIVFSCASCLPSEVQERLLRFVETGGNLLLAGRLPVEDLEGNSATTLVDGLAVKPGTLFSAEHRFLAITGSGWAEHEPSITNWQLQPFASDGKPFLKVLGSGETCGATLHYGKGKVVLITCDPPGGLAFWDGIFSELDLQPRVAHDYAFGGVVLNRVRDRKGQRFVSLINLDLIDKELSVREEGKLLFGGPLLLPGKKAKMLPINVRIGGLHIEWASAEIVEANRTGVRFRQSPAVERASFTGAVKVGPGARIVRRENDSTFVEIEPGFGSVPVSPTT